MAPESDSKKGKNGLRQEEHMKAFKGPYVHSLPSYG